MLIYKQGLFFNLTEQVLQYRKNVKLAGDIFSLFSLGAAALCIVVVYMLQSLYLIMF